MRREITVKKKSLIYIVLIVAVALAAVVLLRNENEKKMNVKIQMAEQFLSNRDYEAALREYQEACKIGPSEAGTVALGEKLYIAMAMEKELDGDIDGAIAVLEEAIGTIPTAQDRSEFSAKLESLRRLKEEMQNPDLAGMTDELMRIVDEWRYYYDMAAEEDKDAIFTSYADTFQKYIVLYESVYGTEECTCGQLYIDSASTLNDKDYFDLGTAYDFVIYFRLVTNDEGKAWILRSVQAEKSGVSAFLNGFSVWCEMKYEETKIEGRSRWTLVSRTLQYSDTDGNIYPMKHNNLYINGTQTYDKYGRLISINMEYVDDTECCKKYIYGNRSEQILDQLKINGQEYRVISDISSEPNVCMENLVLYFAKSSFVRPDVSSETHDWIDLLYVFRDGSVYCANEYYHDYYEKGDCSERYYPQDTDEKWEHIKDWVYLGSISSDDMELILKEADDIDENAKKADYLYTWEWSQLTGQIWKTEVQWQEPPSGDMSKFEKLQDVIKWGTYLSFCVCKNTSCYELWNTEESMYNSSIVSQLSADENTLNLICDVLGSAYYDQWTTISPQAKTGGLQYNTWERTRRIIDLDATEEQMPAADEEIYTEGPFITPELSDPLMNPDPNERIDAYITTLWVNLACDAEVPLCRISTERDVESAIDYFGYDFREAVKGYSIEEFDYVVGCFGRGRSGYYSNKAGSVRYDGDYICIDDDEGYFCIAAIPKTFFEKHLVSTKTIQDIIDQGPKEQKIDAYIISISVDCVSDVGASCFRISTEEDLEYAKAVFGDVFQGDLQKYSLEEYDYYVDFGGYNTPLSFDSVRYYEKNESIYFHERRSVYNGGSGHRSLGRIYMDVAAIPKSIFAEKDYGVCSIQEFQWIKDSLKNAQYLGVINDPNAIKE